MRLPILEFSKFIERGVVHYEKTAPTVSAWLEDLFLRMGESPKDVTLIELVTAGNLMDCGEWEHPNYAANRIYKLAWALGKDTTGLAGF